MSLLETKVIQVENDQDVITNTSNLMGSFGWTVLSVQVTHSQNSKDLGDRVQTTTLNYATMTLQRDKHMDNYAEIVRLENEYYLYEARAREKTKNANKVRQAGQSERANTGCLLFFLIFCTPLCSLVLLYYLIRIILCIVSFIAENIVKKPLPAVDTLIEKMPVNIFNIFNRKSESEAEANEQALLDEANAFQEEAAQRMAEIRQQAESLLR